MLLVERSLFYCYKQFPLVNFQSVPTINAQFFDDVFVLNLIMAKSIFTLLTNIAYQSFRLNKAFDEISASSLFT